MKKQAYFKFYSVSYFFLKQKAKIKMSDFNQQGYQIESIKYFNTLWFIPTVECVLSKIGKPCDCRCHHPDFGGMVHSFSCCEGGFIFD